jgi:outer membrane protein assembly factor BamB
MRSNTIISKFHFLSLSVAALALLAESSSASNWSQFRGPNCSGTLVDAYPPVEISPTNGVLWNIEVPWSPSSPCLWDDRIFLTTYLDGELQTRAYSRNKGRLLWNRSVKPERLEVYHNSEGSPAASTPVADGKRVVSYFGSFGFVCYDLKGKELWRHPLPVALSGGGFGTGTSPILARSTIILNRDQDENSSLLAIDIATGKTIWETSRNEARGSFGTPVIWNNHGVDEIVTPGSIRLNGYDLKTGHEHWLVDGVVGFACTTPVVGDGMLFFAGWSPGKADAPWPTWEQFLERNDKNHDGVIDLSEFAPSDRDFARGMDRNHDGKITKEDWDVVQAGAAKAENVLVAVKPGGQGDITKTHVAWKATRGLPYVPSPLFYEGRVYMIKDGGMISSLDAATGKPFYNQERLEAADKYYASPVAADGRIYLASLPGKLTVIKAGGDKPEVLYQSNFGERIFATPALAGKNLYLRTEKHFYAFGG